MHIARRVCRNPDESNYFPISLDFEIMRLTYSLSKFKTHCTDTDIQHAGTDVRDTRENLIQL